MLPRMDQQTIIADIEAQARGAGVSMSAVCKRADVHPTTFSRWKVSERNPEPTGATLACLTKLHDALREIAAENRRTRKGAGQRSAAA